MLSAADLWSMPQRERRELLLRARPVGAEVLENAAYRGVSLNLPRFVERLTWSTFQKVFYLDPDTGALRGWNVRVEQRGKDAPSVALTKRGRPWTFGHFLVRGPGGAHVPEKWRHAIVLDYARGRNAWLDPMRLFRDPLVAVNDGNADLLLGTMYADFGLFTVPTPSYFTLEREGPVPHVA